MVLIAPNHIRFFCVGRVAVVWTFEVIILVWRKLIMSGMLHSGGGCEGRFAHRVECRGLFPNIGLWV